MLALARSPHVAAPARGDEVALVVAWAAGLDWYDVVDLIGEVAAVVACELDELTFEEQVEQRRKAELIRAGEEGFKILTRAGLDFTHSPWLVALDDHSIWIALDAENASRDRDSARRGNGRRSCPGLGR